MKKKTRDILTIVILVVSMAALMPFLLFPKLKMVEDEVLNDLLISLIPRLISGMVFTFFMIMLGNLKVFTFAGTTIKNTLWCIPALLVAIANFPFTALISGRATIERFDMLPLFLLSCFAIAWMEETIFRGMLQGAIAERIKPGKYQQVFIILASSAVFGLFHLVNIIYSVYGTFLQVGYSFLIGCMLSGVLLKTKNIWYCIFLHALFDVGGMMVQKIGSGSPQDMWFWIFTVIAGVICTVHMLNTFLPKNNGNNSSEVNKEEVK